MKKTRASYRSQFLAGAALAAVVSCAPPAFAQAKNIDIAPQPLAAALYQLGSQTGQQIIFSPELADSKMSKGASSADNIELALNQILDGTGLSYRRTSDAIMIVRASDPQSGSAAGDGADNGTVQALIVTAQKREENIQDVPIAMSAFTQEDLTRSQVAGGADLMTQVPNMTFTKTNFTGYSIQIRGIGTQAISATTDPAVAVAENNTPFIRNRFFEQEFYDLQRVEVLRGPQGTLYGRNATAGVVNIITAKPSFHYEAKLSGDVGNYNSTRLEGMLNLPLVEDKVALRLAGAWTKRDGYDLNQVTGQRIDGRDLWSTRVSLRVTPNDRLNANLIWEHFQENDDRLRSGKQLCNTDVVTSYKATMPTVAGSDLFNGQTVSFVTNMNTPLGFGFQQIWTGVQGTFSQGCKPQSLYSPDSFQTPNGISLPYVLPLASIGVKINPGTGGNYFDAYASRTQSRDLRTIESTVQPRYQAETNIVQFQFSADLTKDLTLTSETGYGSDTIFSTQDFNRFATAPGVFQQPEDVGGHFGGFWRDNWLLHGPNGGVFCDPQIGCADRLVAVDLSTAKSDQFSQELRLGSNFAGPFNFSLGANFLRYDTEDKYYVFINTLSMYATLSPYNPGGHGGSRLDLSPYQPNVTDNAECLRFGFREPVIGQIQSVNGCEYVDPNPIGSLNDLGHNYFLSKNPYKLISYAVFGEAYYNITDDLKLTAGLRWTVDKKEAPRIPSWLLSADNAGYPVAETVRQEWREPTGRLALDWKPHLSFTDETLIYGSYAHGYKAGGMNPPAPGVVCYFCGGNAELAEKLLGATHPKTFGPEFVNAFEVGSKNTLLDGRLTANLAAFYYDYTGYQISQIINRSAVNYNFDAKVWGLEIETDWRPLENLRLGFKGGYENTRIADGMKAIDIMDRTAGDPNWVTVRPFPTFPSNCILPAWMFVGSADGQVIMDNVGNRGSGNPGPCEMAYVLGLDPVTGFEYRPDPGETLPGVGDLPRRPGYPGFDPSTAPNGGAGISKDLSGNSLPNAPHFTATVTGDYTVPLPSNWLLTLHGDFYYQSEAWARVFNTPGYDKLKAYTNVNFAAIFTNEDAGWKVMAYVKNVLDKDNITGSFLNSDDTGLTTNVFLNEPRLYGLRVTKEWTGQGWWTGANPNHVGPYPLTVELGGMIQRQDAPYQPFTVGALANLPSQVALHDPQDKDLDWGDGRSVKITYRPDGAAWNVSAAMRYGRTNNKTSNQHHEYLHNDHICGVGPYGAYAYLGAFLQNLFCNPASAKYVPRDVAHGGLDWTQAAAKDREEHLMVDFAVGHDVGLGSRFARSEMTAGLRYGAFKSNSVFTAEGLGDWNIPGGWLKYDTNLRAPAYAATVHSINAKLMAEREFKGAGPMLSWDAAAHLLGGDETGRVNLDWSVGAGVLFGKQKTGFSGSETDQLRMGSYTYWPLPPVGDPVITPLPDSRSKSVSVPVVDLSLGLSYEIGRMRVGTGYRWERYYNVLDAGWAEHQSYDRTIDGPYFKLAVGFGG